MAKLYDMANMTVASAPGTGTIALGAPANADGVTYLSFGAAGAQTGDVVSYRIRDGANWELGRGTYTAAGLTLTRAPLWSSAGAATAINASAAASVFISVLAEDVTGGPFLPLAGGTLTGALNINAAAGNWATLGMRAPTGNRNVIQAYVNANQRWEIDLGDGSAESTGNVGSNFGIARFTDAGAYIDFPLTISRANGGVVINNTLTTVGSITVNGPGCFVSSGSNPFALYATSTASYCPQIVLLNTTADTSPPYLILQKGRAGNTTTLSGDSLGTLAFQGFGSANGNANGALISAISIGAAGTNVIPSVLTFTTAAASGLFERMRIDQNGNVGIGTGAPSYMLHVKGAGVAEIRVESTSYSKISFNATSSAANSGRWQLYGGVNALFLDALNDAENSATPVMQVFRSGQAVTAVAFPSGALSINQYLYFANVTSGGPFLEADTTNLVFRLGTGNGGLYVQDSGGNNRAVIDQTGRIGLTHGGLGGTTGSQIMALRSFQTDGNNDAMEFLWNRNGPTTGWGNVDFIIRRNVDGTNAQQAILFTGTPSGPVFTITNQGAWRYSIDITNQAWILPASGGSYYWYSYASANIMQLTNAGALTVTASITSQQNGVVTNGSNAGFNFADRGGAATWIMYATGGMCRFYNGMDRVKFDSDGTIYTTSNIILNNTHAYYCYNANSTPVAMVSMDASNQGRFAAPSAWNYWAGHIMPPSDNTMVCGYNGVSWNQVWSWSYTTASDRRGKTDIEELPPDCLDLVMAIAPKRFRFRIGADRKTIHWGWIAQEMGEAMRAAGHEFGGHVTGYERISGDRRDFSKEPPAQGLNINELTAVLWKACQEMAARIEQLEAICGA